MLILNADDYGRTPLATDRILACHARGSVTSASAMVFMNDSERAARLAGERGLDTGLHVNLTEEFSGNSCGEKVQRCHRRVVRFLRGNRFASLFFHPFLRQDFRCAFESQWNEYVRLYGAPPSHIDGHHHAHLCANMLWDGLLPGGQKVRRNFSFQRGEKSGLNRLYRSVVDRRLLRRHRSTDYLFSLPACVRSGKLERALDLARTANVELETHPEQNEDFTLLMSDAFQNALAALKRVSYAEL